MWGQRDWWWQQNLKNQDYIYPTPSPEDKENNITPLSTLLGEK